MTSRDRVAPGKIRFVQLQHQGPKFFLCFPPHQQGTTGGFSYCPKDGFRGQLVSQTSHLTGEQMGWEPSTQLWNINPFLTPD